MSDGGDADVATDLELGHLEYVSESFKAERLPFRMVRTRAH
jgi:hypothetical protein